MERKKDEGWQRDRGEGEGVMEGWSRGRIGEEGGRRDRGG